MAMHNFEDITERSIILYTCHIVIGSFLLNTQPHVQLVDSTVVTWLSCRNWTKNHSFVLGIWPQLSSHLFLIFSCIGLCLSTVHLFCHKRQYDSLDISIILCRSELFGCHLDLVGCYNNCDTSTPGLLDIKYFYCFCVLSSLCFL